MSQVPTPSPQLLGALNPTTLGLTALGAGLNFVLTRRSNKALRRAAKTNIARLQQMQLDIQFQKFKRISQISESIIRNVGESLNPGNIAEGQARTLAVAGDVEDAAGDTETVKFDAETRIRQAQERKENIALDAQNRMVSELSAAIEGGTRGLSMGLGITNLVNQGRAAAYFRQLNESNFNDQLGVAFAELNFAQGLARILRLGSGRRVGTEAFGFLETND